MNYYGLWYSVGFMFHGWKYFSDGYVAATKWFSILWLPLIPIQRYKFLVVPNPDEKNPEAKRYMIKEDLPLNFSEIVLTYCKAYLLLPLVSLGPIFIPVYFQLFILGGPVDPPLSQTHPLLSNFFQGYGILAILNMIFWPAWIVIKERRRRLNIS